MVSRKDNTYQILPSIFITCLGTWHEEGLRYFSSVSAFDKKALTHG